MWVRRRIAALALFGVQLLQGVLPAAGAVCEIPPVGAPTSATAIADAVTAHHHHGAVPAPASGRSADTPTPAPHQTDPAACPMAMACTVAGVMSVAVAVSTIDVDIAVHRSMHVADWPISLDVAPETPPPRV